MIIHKLHNKIWTNYKHYMVLETFQNSMESGKGHVNHYHTIVPMKILVNGIVTQQYYGNITLMTLRWCDCVVTMV